MNTAPLRVLTLLALGALLATPIIGAPESPAANPPAARWKGSELLPPLPADPQARAAVLDRVRALNAHRIPSTAVIEPLAPKHYGPFTPTPVPSRTLEAAAPRTRTLAPASPGPLGSFPGFSYNGAAPANADIAAGPNHVVVTAGDEFAVYDKCGVLKDGGPIGSYFPVPGNLQFSEGRVIYDDWDNRWVMGFVGNTFSGASYVYLFVTNNSNPLLGWYLYGLAVTISTEYPHALHLAADPDILYFTFDHINLAGGYLADATIDYVDKAALYAMSGVTVIGFSSFSHLPDVVPAFGIRPSQLRSYDGNMYFLGTNIDGGSEVDIRVILDPLGTPSVSNTVVSVPGYAPPPNSQQSDGTYIESGDARHTDIVYFSGTLYATRVYDASGAAVYTQAIDPSVPAQVAAVQSNGNAGAAIDVDETGAITLAQVAFTPATNPGSIYSILPLPFTGTYDSGSASSPQGAYHQGGFGTDSVPYLLTDYMGAALDPTDHRTVWIHGVSSSSSPAGTWRTTVTPVSRFAESSLQATVAPPALAGPPGGPYNGDAYTCTLINNGGTTANWTLDGYPSWVTPGATSGYLTPGGFQDVSLVLNSSAYALPSGLHSSQVTFTNWTGSGAVAFEIAVGVSDTICTASIIDLRPDPVPTSVSSPSVEVGMFITAIRDIDVCAVGIDQNASQVAQDITVSIYEADGDIRGALLASHTSVAADTGMVEHLLSIPVQLAACRDYEIVFTRSAGGIWNEWSGYPLPYDVGGAIRIRNGRSGGVATPILPGISIIGSGSGCASAADLDPGTTVYSTNAATVGIGIIPDRNLGACSLEFEADLTPGTTVAAQVWESNAGTLVQLMGTGATVVTASGMMLHSVPLNAALTAGQEYEILWNIEGGTWRYFDALDFSSPYTAGEFTVLLSQVGGLATRAPHVVVHYDDVYGGVAAHLYKPSGPVPPPSSVTATPLDHGAYLAFASAYNVYGLGVWADIPAGQTLTASIYDAGSGSRGSLLAVETTASIASGMQWHDVPIAFTASAAGDQIEVAFTCPTVNEIPYWDDTTGLPFVSGPVTVNDGVVGADSSRPELVYMRVYTCADQVTAAPELPSPTRPFLFAPSPNPASGKVRLGYSLDGAGPADLSIYDVQGRKVRTVFRVRSLPGGPGEVTFNTRTLAANMYFVQLKTPAGTFVRKLVVMH